jgi:hypothetical protein
MIIKPWVCRAKSLLFFCSFFGLILFHPSSQAQFCAQLFSNSTLNPQSVKKNDPMNYVRISTNETRGPQPLLWPKMLSSVTDFLQKIQILDQDLPKEAITKVTENIQHQVPSYTDYLELKTSMMKNWKSFLRPENKSSQLALQLYEQLQVLSFIESYILWPAHIQKKLHEQSKAQDLSFDSEGDLKTLDSQGLFSEKDFSRSKNHRINQDGSGSDSKNINIYSEFSEIYFDYGYRQVVNSSGMFENNMMNPKRHPPASKKAAGNLRWSTQRAFSEVRIPLQKGTRPLMSQPPNGDLIIEKFPGVFYLINRSHSQNFEISLIHDGPESPLTEVQKSFFQAPSGIATHYFEKSVIDFLKNLQRKNLSARGTVLAIQNYLENSGVFKYYNYSENHEKEFQDIDVKMHEFEKQMPSAAASTHVKVIQCERASELALIFLRDFFKIPTRVVTGFRGVLKPSGHVVMNSPIGHAWIEVWLNGKFERFEVTPKQPYVTRTDDSQESSEKKNSNEEQNSDAQGGSGGHDGLQKHRYHSTQEASDHIKNMLQLEKEIQASIQNSLKKISQNLREGNFSEAKELLENLSSKFHQLQKERPLTKSEESLVQKLSLALEKIYQQNALFDEKEVHIANFFYQLPSPLVEKAILMEYGPTAKIPGTESFANLYRDLIEGKLRSIELLHQIEKSNHLNLSGKPEPRTTHHPTGDPAINPTRFHDITPAISADQFEMFVGDRRPGEGLLDSFLRGEQLSYAPVEQFPRVDPYNVERRHIVMILSDHSGSVPNYKLTDLSKAQDAWVIQHMMSQKSKDGRLMHVVHYTQFGSEQEPTKEIKTEEDAIQVLHSIFFDPFIDLGGTEIDQPIQNAYDRILQAKNNNHELQYADILLASDGEQNSGPINIQAIQQKQQMAASLGLNVRFNVFNYHSHIPALEELSQAMSGHHGTSGYTLFDANEVKRLYQVADQERTSKIRRGFHYQTNLDTLRLAREISYAHWKPTNFQPDMPWLYSLKTSLDLWLRKDRHFYQQGGIKNYTSLSFLFPTIKNMKEFSTWRKNEKLYYLEQLLKTQFDGFNFSEKNSWSKFHHHSLIPIQELLDATLEGK